MRRQTVVTPSESYAARLDIDYPEELDRFTTFLRLIWIIPVLIVLSSLGSGLFFATLLMIVFRVRYPRWWFDFTRELTRFATRVGAYFALLTDQYPSTVDEQSVHLEIDYPDVEQDLHRLLPLVSGFWRSHTMSCLRSLRSVRSSFGLLPGSPSSSRGVIPEACSTTWWGLPGGRCE
jgi:hypothetical protein